MGKRNITNQSRHDKKVEALAYSYLRYKWDVYADIKGWRKPALRNRYRPDVVAKKGNSTIIIEVETKNSLHTDQNQINAFRRYANNHPYVTFKLIMA